MAFSLLWSCGLVISIVIFAVAFGLTLSNGNVSRKFLTIFTAGSLVATFLLIYLMDIFKVQLNSMMGTYNYLLLFLIALILIFTGYVINGADNYKRNFARVFSLSYLCFMLTVLICVASKQSLLGLNSLQLGLFTACLFSLIMILTFVACKRIKLIGESQESLGTLYIIAGIYFLVVSLLLPNIMALDMNAMKPINVVSIESIAVAILVLVVVVVLGLLYYKKNTLLK